MQIRVLAVTSLLLSTIALKKGEKKKRNDKKYSNEMAEAVL